MSETVILDPVVIDATRSQIDITTFIAAAGPDWGDSDIEAAVASQTFGGAIVDYRIPQRSIKIPLSLRAITGTSFATIRTQLQAKVALFQREGGTIMRQTSSATLYADIVKAALHLGGSWLQAYRSADVDATLELECRPDWWGDEVTLGDHVETSAAELIFTEATVSGSYPARCRIIVDNDQATDQHGLIWGVRCRNYGAASTERLAYEAEALQPLDASTKVALAGASGGTVMRHPSLPAGDWCPVMTTTIGGTAFMTHKGSYRVWARCRSGTAAPKLRFLWDVGDLSAPVTNDVVQLPGPAEFYLLDFGEVRLDPSPVGTHRWQGVVQAKAAQQGNQVDIDRLWFQPLDESAGSLVAVQSASSLVTSSLKVWGTGANNAGTGTINWDMTGLPYKASGMNTGQITHYLEATGFGFTIPAGVTIVGIIVQVWKYMRFSSGVAKDQAIQLLKAGVVQATNKASANPWSLDGATSVYGAANDLWGSAWTPSDINDVNFGVAIAAQAYTDGVTPEASGIYITVAYVNAGGFSPAPDAVLYATRSAELRTEGMYRQDSTGAVYAPVSNVVGDLPRLPPSGLESRPVEVFVKASRGNLADEADAGIDDISALIKYRPTFLITG